MTADFNAVCSGSSPRVRGTDPRSTGGRAGRRFIPACAGNRLPGRSIPKISPVHPRVCGEQTRNWLMTSGLSGSSPRVRGTVRKNRNGLRPLRFIPACAGNSLTLPRACAKKSVHPRVCGEQASSKTARLSIDGSSPRVRGTVTQVTIEVNSSRFIPACAGNSQGIKVPAEPDPVHPRVCGEQVVSAGSAISVSGSSPRVRGTGPVVAIVESECRFIPACAGNRE